MIQLVYKVEKGEIVIKYYIGGSLFTDKQIKQRLYEEEKLKETLKDVDIYNPITNDEINDKTKEPTSQDIFLQDTREILSSDVITADLDDIDTGLAAELGIAYGVNYMRDMITECLGSDDVEKELRRILKIIPEKTVYATCSDIRQDTANENGVYKSWGHNLYVVGGIELMGKIFRHFDDVIEYIKEGEDE